MTPKREYSILPQGEGADFHHHVREGRTTVTSQYICLFTVIAVVICLILAGVATLTASMFYSDQVSTTFGHIWYSYESKKPNATSTSTSKTTSADSSFIAEGSSSASAYESRNHSASVPVHNPSDYSDQINKTLGPNHHHHNHIHHNKNSSGDSTSYNNDGGSGAHYSDHSTAGENDTSSESEESDSTAMDTTGKDQEFINMEELKDKFGEAMRDFEKHMENITGIRKAEFVVPIFMLICFLSLFSIISLCCCIMMRRRDNRRRKLFGKLITDLQTGDSKTVLLNHSDLDD